jgi:hypothetical protein
MTPNPSLNQRNINTVRPLIEQAMTVVRGHFQECREGNEVLVDCRSGRAELVGEKRASVIVSPDLREPPPPESGNPLAGTRGLDRSGETMTEAGEADRLQGCRFRKFAPLNASSIEEAERLNGPSEGGPSAHDSSSEDVDDWDFASRNSI